MYITVDHAKGKPDYLRVVLDGHQRHVAVRGELPETIDPLVRLAAEYYWRTEADGPKSYRVALMED